MNNIGTTIGLVFGCIFLAAGIYCAFKENKVTGTYKAFKVYGRIKAYFAMSCIVGGVTGLIIYPCFIQNEKMPPMAIVASIAGGVVAMAVGILIYVWTYRKCPDFLKKRCIISMIITGLGVAMKITVFFLGFVWKLVSPEQMQDSSGNTLYVYGSSVYDDRGKQVGTRSGSSQFTPNENYQGK